MSKFPYTFRDATIPDYMEHALDAYVNDHVLPGHFLTAVLENDLYQAISRADDMNVRALVAYIGYLYNECPHACWGSPEKVKAWVNQ